MFSTRGNSLQSLVQTDNNQPHGTQSFLRSQQLLYSRNFPYFIETAVSWPHSQQPSTCPCHDPYDSSSHPSILLIYDPF